MRKHPYIDTIARYFYDHHLGTIYGDLLTHREGLEALPWFEQLQRTAPPAAVEEYRRFVAGYVGTVNWYWSEARPAIERQPAPSPAR